MAWWEREISVIAENYDSDSWIDRFITCCQSLICPAGCMWSSVKVCYKVTFQSRWQLMKHKALCEIYTLHIFALLLLLYDGERRTAQIWYNADREKWTGGEVCYSELRWEHTEQSKERQQRYCGHGITLCSFSIQTTRRQLLSGTVIS